MNRVIYDILTPESRRLLAELYSTPQEFYDSENEYGTERAVLRDACIALSAAFDFPESAGYVLSLIGADNEQLAGADPFFAAHDGLCAAIRDFRTKITT